MTVACAEGVTGKGQPGAISRRTESMRSTEGTGAFVAQMKR